MRSIVFLLTIALTCGLFSSCARNSEAVWEDTRTASRHVGRGLRTLGGKHGDSRQVRSRDEFIDYRFNEDELDFIPLADEEQSERLAAIEQPRFSPGDERGPVPGIDGFRDPATIPGLSGIFGRIYFPYNSSAIKGEENRDQLRTIAIYMKAHPNTYLFIEGHCDERGAEAYNLALGTRRSNAVRSSLVKEGVNPDNLFTVSYGKEKPIAMGHDEQAWSKNRRAEFKVYEQ